MDSNRKLFSWLETDYISLCLVTTYCIRVLQYGRTYSLYIIHKLTYVYSSISE